MELKDLQILVSSSDSPENDRQDILKNAVVLERLREKLPGWISRDWIVDRNGKTKNWWPVALIKFKQLGVVSSTREPIPAIQLEAVEANEKTPAAKTPASVEEQDVVVAAWRIKNVTDGSPLLYLSAAKFNRRGFQEMPELDDEVAKNVTENVRRLWGKPSVRVVTEFTLMPLDRLDKTLDARLAQKRNVRDDDVVYDFGEQGTFNALRQSPDARPTMAEDLVYSGISDLDRAVVDRLRNLLVTSIKVMHQSVGGGPLDPEATASKINAFLGGESGNELKIYSQHTSFYRGYALYRMVGSGFEVYAVAPNWKALSDQASAEPKQEDFAIILDGTSPPIHNLNTKLGKRKRITDETATDYLCFFCKFVQGDDGAFLVPQSASDLDWKEFPPVEKSRRDVVAKYVVRPMAAIRPSDPAEGEQAENDGQDPALKFIRIATVNHGSALFLSVFEISATGFVEILDFHWLIKDLPIRPFKLGAEKSLLVRKTRR